MKYLKKLCFSGIFTVVLCAIPLFCFILSGKGQATHQEANCFILIYNNSQLPLAKLIFDPLRTDWQCFQARELSYLIDALDARFIGWCIKMHLAHFYSLSSIILLLISAGLIHRNLKRLFPRTIPYLLPLFPLLYTLCNLENLSFFRSSKPWVSFGILIIFFHLAKVLQKPEKFASLRTHLPMLSTLVLIPFFDRIGFFAAATCAAGTIVLLMLSSFRQLDRITGLSEQHSPALLTISIGALGAVILSIIYNFYIAQELIFAFNGYYPSYFYQRLPENSFSDWSSGLAFISCNCGFIVTSISDPLYLEIAGFIFILFLLVALTAPSRAPGTPMLRLLIFTGLFTAMGMCSTLMISRHPAIKTLDVMFGRYFSPFFAVIAALFSIAVCALRRRNIWQKIGIAFVVLALLCRTLQLTGIITTPEYPNGSMNFHNHSTAETIKLLNNPELPLTRIIPLSSWQLVKYFRNSPDVFPMAKNTYTPEKIK